MNRVDEHKPETLVHNYRILSIWAKYDEGKRLTLKTLNMLLQNWHGFPRATQRMKDIIAYLEAHPDQQVSEDETDDEDDKKI